MGNNGKGFPSWLGAYSSEGMKKRTCLYLAFGDGPPSASISACLVHFGRNLKFLCTSLFTVTVLKHFVV